MYVVYILYSRRSDKSYVGFTTDLINRFKSHNELGQEFTKRYRPWVVLHCEFFESKKEAQQREKYFKSGKGYYERLEIIKNLK